MSEVDRSEWTTSQHTMEINLNRLVGKTIKEHLGGRTFCVMTGAKNFVLLNYYGAHKGGGLTFTVGRNSKRVNRVSVLYDAASDLYIMEFGRVWGSNYKVLEKVEGVYFDQLQSVFTTHTGLETRL